MDLNATRGAGIERFTEWKKRRTMVRRFDLVRPAGRTHLEVEVLYLPGKGTG